jgi:hypothetical protein
MRRSAFVIAIALVVTTLAAVAAAADGGPSPGVAWGGSGIVAQNGQVRYVAIPTGRTTVVEVVQVHGGTVLRSNSIRGLYGVPWVAADGSAGGLSRDGRTLVLASFTNTPGQLATTRFALLRTRTLHRFRGVALRGSFSFDALSPDASTLYLIQYTSARDYRRYRVRAYDVASRRLIPGAIVDKREPDEAMAGSPASRATSGDGRWAYTLYARQGRPPFVHALDTVGKTAFCVDLPLRLSQQRQMQLRFRFSRGGDLEVRAGSTTLALVNTVRLEARRIR